MKQLHEIFVSPNTSVLQALNAINAAGLQILLVVDEQERLIGSVTDGDFRRGILHDIDMEAPVSEIMNSSPLTVPEGTARDVVVAFMQANEIHCVPVVNAVGSIVALETESRLLWQGVKDTWVVLMAGGLGMRLRPLTEKTPKPLLKVNGKPILESILERFFEQGFRNFFIAVNYKAEMIKEYFGDGSKWGCNIAYLQEDKRLGTAGALSLLPKDERPNHVIVMNGDLLTTVDFRQFLDFHQKTSSHATMCVRDYSIQVPYGVVEVEGHQFKGVKEKPAHRYYINAGIYILSSSMLDHVPEGKFFDITELFESLYKKGNSVSVFPMRENWLDIGDLKEYERASNVCLMENH